MKASRARDDSKGPAGGILDTIVNSFENMFKKNK
jgi:hypothetical protein